jgi:hypothetical protein
MVVHEVLGAFGSALAEEIATRLAKKLRADNAGWVPQEKSDLGRRKHCAAVRRRMEEGRADATIVIRDGRKVYLMSPEAFLEELTRPRAKAKLRVSEPVEEDPVTSIRARVRRKLGIE